MPTILNEKSLENLITNYLTKHQGYDLGVSDDYDKTYGMDLSRFETFLRATQPELIASSRVFETATNRRKFFERLRDEITKRGVVDVLRKGVKHLSRTFELYMPLPSELSEQAQKRYALNRFTVIRQLHYSSVRSGQSVDMVIFINGLPILTMELKNQLTCQSTAHAVAQYRSDRDPKELLFGVGRCAVHFALDDETVEMCTKLSGRDSWFLPFNKGNEDGAATLLTPTDFARLTYGRRS
ncbi:type I restriction endonuclease [Porphyromonas gingivalis]|uniref:type I restriction endonuclease n=1 Tax=Porphyromonas gingivalis TaxID=837 RepID=UPI001EEA7651|nr:type I restriction endonuclease [Porphyromonas gingivalis]